LAPGTGMRFAGGGGHQAGGFIGLVYIAGFKQADSRAAAAEIEVGAGAAALQV